MDELLTGRKQPESAEEHEAAAKSIMDFLANRNVSGCADPLDPAYVAAAASIANYYATMAILLTLKSVVNS